MMDKRTFGAVLAVFGIWFIWSTFVVAPHAREKNEREKRAKAEQAAIAASLPSAASNPVLRADNAQPAAGAAPVDAPAEAPAIDTRATLAHGDVAVGEVSTLGAGLTRLTLSQYKEGGVRRGEEKHPVELVTPFADKLLPGVELRAGDKPIRFNTIASGPSGTTDLTGELPGFAVTASWAATKTPYVFELTATYTNRGSQPMPLATTLRVSAVLNEKTLRDKSMFEQPPDVVTPVVFVDDDLVKHELGKKDDPDAKLQAHWAGVDRQYFLLAAATRGAGSQARFVEERSALQPLLVAMSADLVAKEEIVAPGATSTQSFLVFAGPKKTELLQAPAVRFEEAIDYKVLGMPLGFLCRPMLWVLNTAYKAVGSYGLAILILTLVVKLLLLPATQKSFVSMQKMRALQPEIEKIKRQYPDDREKQGLAQMQLYREKNVSPFSSGCLPTLLQMPIYFAFWRMLWAAVELYQQEFLWLGDLTAKDPYFILPLIYGGTMFLQQKLSPPMGDPQQQKMMLYIMPPLITVLMVSLPSGLVFYSMVNNVLTIIQQTYINKKFGGQTTTAAAV